MAIYRGVSLVYETQYSVLCNVVYGSVRFGDVLALALRCMQKWLLA